MGETQPTYAQGAWRAYHISTYKKVKNNEQHKTVITCSCCGIKIIAGTFTKMDSSWYGVVTCPECTPLVNQRKGLIVLEYPVKVKPHYSKEQQYKLF